MMAFSATAGEQVALNPTVNHGTSNTVRLVNVLVPSGLSPEWWARVSALSGAAVTELLGGCGRSMAKWKTMRCACAPALDHRHARIIVGGSGRTALHTQGTAFLARPGGEQPRTFLHAAAAARCRRAIGVSMPPPA